MEKIVKVTFIFLLFLWTKTSFLYATNIKQQANDTSASAHAPDNVEINKNEVGMSEAASIWNHYCVKDLFNKKKTTVVRVIGIQDIQNNNEPDKNVTHTQSVLSGTGFFVSDQAHVVTAASIVASAHVLWVEYFGLSYAAECIGYDPLLNIAIIRLLQPPEQFERVDITPKDNFELANIGDFAVFIGCRLELDPAPAIGNIVGKNISYGEHVFLTTYLRSDIEFCGGESGAPVFGLDGKLIGMMVAALPELHSSFILPRRAIKRTYDDIIKLGSTIYSSLGIEIHAEYKLGIGQQIIISRVIHDSSAKRCGLQAGDILVSMNEFHIKHREDLHNALFFSHPGETMIIVVSRNGQQLTFHMPLEQSVAKQ